MEASAGHQAERDGRGSPERFTGVPPASSPNKQSSRLLSRIMYSCAHRLVRDVCTDLPTECILSQHLKPTSDALRASISWWRLVGHE